MGTNWYLFSPLHKKSALIGHDGLSGIKVRPTEYHADKFLLWAIENHVTDVVLVDENDPRLDGDEHFTPLACRPKEA